MNILAIDPGTEQSGFVVVDEGLNILDKGIGDNDILIFFIKAFKILKYFQHPVVLVIEGMTLYRGVTDDTKQTIIWTGRFIERFMDVGRDYKIIDRKDVRKHLDADSDAGVIAALVDRFGGGSMKTAKGTKGAPGKFHGFNSHVWQAFALAVTYVDKLGK